MARRSDERDAARAEYIARMEKDGEVNLRQLADDLHLKYDTVRRWKAKDGWGPPAPRKPGGQPGNKNAVGNPGGGAPVGNENAMKDGAYATIFFDKLTPEEKQIVENCHPYSSWERGSNENVNGMIRRRHPKGTDFSKVTAEEIAATENWINSYPRKIFGYKSAGTMFRECLRELGLTA